MSPDNLQGSEGATHPKTIPYNQSRDHNTGGSHNSSDRGSNSTSGEANSCCAPQWILGKPYIYDFLGAFLFSGSQNQKKGTRAPKIPKYNAVIWGEALSPPHANAYDCDEYSLPMEKRYGGKGETHMHVLIVETTCKNVHKFTALWAHSV